MLNTLKRSTTALAGLALAALPLAGVANAQEERRFEVEDFDRIDVSAGVMVLAELGEAKSVLVKTAEGDFSDFRIEVRNGELQLSREYNRLRWHTKKAGKNYKVVVTNPTLRALEASSGSHARISRIDAERFIVDLSSGAHAELEGRCQECAVDISSGAHLKAKELECATARIDVSSGGHGELSATNAVMADASSGGHVTVHGSPQRVSIDKSSGGRISVASAPEN